MNILFLTENELRHDLGGTDRISITLAKEFSRMGHCCSLAYCRAVENADDCLFGNKILLDDSPDREFLLTFLRDSHIDIVISNLVGIRAKSRYIPLFYQLSKQAGARMVNCYHAMPGEDLLGNRVKSCIWRIAHGGSTTASLKDMLLHIIPQRIVRQVFNRTIIRKYRLLYDNCDSLVMLSEESGKLFADLAGVKYDSKFAVMPNALSFNEFLDPSLICYKEKCLLLIARMDEKSKRISFALKAWREICGDKLFSDWEFIIAGAGPDLEYFRKMSSDLGLDRISFLGRVDDIVSLYKRSSIFIMTSSYEGWGLTLTESQQFGCVPVVLNSFPALSTVITHCRNGLIVENDNIEAFVSSVKWLMSHCEERELMSANAIEDSRRWEIGGVARRWVELFESLFSRR